MGQTAGVKPVFHCWLSALAFASIVLLGWPSSALAEPAATNLVAGKKPIDSRGVKSPELLTDGRAPDDGEGWDSIGSARLADREAFVTYDLGAERAIRALWLQADNNDRYEIALSTDNAQFEPIWVAPENKHPGLRPRFVANLEASGRYLRLRPAGGDASLGVSELQVFDAVPAPFPPNVARIPPPSSGRRFRDRTLLFGLALIAVLVLASKRSERGTLAALLGVVVVSGYGLAEALISAWPVSNREVSMVRGVVAMVAACAVARLAFSTPRHPVHRGVALGTLGACAVVAIAAFYNLLRPQFYDANKNQDTFAHYLDLRQYYPTAKYFREVGYRGTYEADVLALSADTNRSLSQMAKVPLRDLYTLRDSTVQQQRSRIEARRQAFSQARFDEYRSDARFFRVVMGRSYSETFQDFGGNATPFWMSIAHLLFSAIAPSTLAFTLTGLIDALLLLAAFVAIGRSFGLVPAFVCAVVFGANDFIMYGTNWGGATLRHDWLCYLAFGVCALRTERYRLGGAFLALATMIRAFPALALVGVGLPIVWGELDAFLAERRKPTWSELVTRNRSALRVLSGAAVAMLVCFVFSVVILPPGAWPEWYSKVAQGDGEPHPAAIGLRSLIAGWEPNQPQVLRARMPLYVAVFVGYLAGVALACRKASLHQAALLGLILVPVMFYPANYYLHYVFLLPLVATEALPTRAQGLSWRAAAIYLTLLGLCAAQYFTVPLVDWGTHFYLASVLLFTALALLLFFFSFERLRAFLSAPAPEG